MLNKKDLRKQVNLQISELTNEYKKFADNKIYEHVINLETYKNAKTIFIFVGVKNEINTHPIIDQALKSGKIVLVPLCIRRGIMEARQITSLEDLKETKLGLLEPNKHSKKFDIKQIDLSFIPCLAADKYGNRLGYGGGYYDRYFSNFQGPAIILCREKQVFEKIHTDSHDIAFENILTEENLYKARSKNK